MSLYTSSRISVDILFPKVFPLDVFAIYFENFYRTALKCRIQKCLLTKFSNSPTFLQEILFLPVFLRNLFLFLLPIRSENFPRFSSRHILRNVYSIMIQSKICCRRKVSQNSLLKAFFPRNSSRSSCSCSCNPSLKLLQFPYIFFRNSILDRFSLKSL